MEWALETNYFKWLCAKVVYHHNPSPSLTYWELLKLLHRTEFVWLISGDDNRVADGLELRDDFLFENRSRPKEKFQSRHEACSVLEMLVAFSKRAEFITETSALDWFWIFIENLGLDDFNDGMDNDPADIEEIVDIFIWRTYNRRGEGGLFPIRHPCTDQRNVEIWYQFHEYLLDQEA